MLMYAQPQIYQPLEFCLSLQMFTPNFIQILYNIENLPVSIRKMT